MTVQSEGFGLDNDQRMQWFKDAKYGLFIHWGLFSYSAGYYKGELVEKNYTEWMQQTLNLPHREYANLSKDFNPVHFNAEEWVLMAQDMGFKYITFTTKHHDGFSNFRTKASSFNIVDATPFKRDPLEELALACEKFGMHLNLYYSQALDWSHPDAFYYGDQFFPELVERGHRVEHDVYLEEKVFPQLNELVTQYGRIGAFWFDTPWYNQDKRCRKTGQRISEYVRKIAPEVLINSRVVDAAFVEDDNNRDLYDYLSLPDHTVVSKMDGMFKESPDSICDSYGYDKRPGIKLKSSEQILERLKGMNDNDGNLLLNVGPMGDGRFSDSAKKVLRGVSQKRSI